MSTSTRFLACKEGLLISTSIITSLSKITTFFTELLSIKLLPSPGAVICSNAFKTAVLVNRNHKKYPVKADFKGISLSTSIQEHINVVFSDENSYAVLE